MTGVAYSVCAGPLPTVLSSDQGTRGLPSKSVWQEQNYLATPMFAIIQIKLLWVSRDRSSTPNLFELMEKWKHVISRVKSSGGGVGFGPG